MALSPKLELRTSQGRVMTPQLQQAIKLLQLSNLELNDYVEQELERNPVLERDEGDGEVVPGDAEPADTAPVEATEIELDHVQPGTDAGGAESEGPLDADYENVFEPASPGEAVAPPDQQGPWSRVSGSGGGLDGGFSSLEQTLSAGITLKAHLLGQFNVAREDAVVRMIGAYLIESLDDAGYLVEPLDEAADKLGCPIAAIEEALACLQSLDPPGVGARDLAECLALQLRDLDRLDPAMQALLDNLHKLAEHDMPALIRLCGVDAEDIAEMIREIRALDPKPGLAYDYEMAQPVVPDVFVRADPSGGWRIELNADTLPRVLVNATYCALVGKAGTSRDDRNYLTDCVNNANWLVKSLDQRARTILKVSNEIVKQQAAFFEHGVQHLRPLNLRTVAAAIEMHESTVSRVTANKYMATTRGIFELKYFFTAAIASAAGGDAHSAEAVRHRIRDLIAEETPKAILSDDRLVELLHGCGIEIARRTVAKYREALGIPSSVQRRRQKRMAL